jgi:Ran GTPase-activating protein 1
MATSKKIFSLEGKGLKLDTAADLEPHIESLRSMSDVEEVRFLGNTLGVEACKTLGEVLETKKSLQVSLNLASQRNLYKSILDMELC